MGCQMCENTYKCYICISPSDVIVNTSLQLSAVWDIMHECSNHIQHEGEARGLYMVTQECIIPYYNSTQCMGVLTSLYRYNADLAISPQYIVMHTSVVSDRV